MLSFELINLHRCWPHEQNTFYTYNRGQTSWNTLAFVGLSWNHTWPTSAPPPSPNHKQGWTGVSRIFPEFPLYIGWGEGEPQDFSERLIALFYDSTRKLQKIISTALLTQGLFSWIVDSATAESFMSENSYVIDLFIFSFFFFCHQNSALRECSLTIIGSQCDWGCESES